MNADERAPEAAEPKLVRFGTCMVGGVLAGIIAGILGVIIAEGLEFSSSRVSLADFVAARIRIGEYWRYFERIGGAVLPGAIFGLICALFSRRTRQPIALASLWAFIFGIFGLAFVVIMLLMGELGKQPPAATLAMLAILPLYGAILGCTVGFTARLLERGLDRVQRRPPRDMMD